jgi:hypothetical protein
MLVSFAAAAHACPEFSAPFTVFPSAFQPADVAACDLDADGRDDLVIANYYGSSVTIKLGGIDDAHDVPVRAGPRSIASADFDADGKLDLAVATFGRVSMRRGGGNGNFDLWPDIFTDITVVTVVAGDFDADTHADLVTLRRTGADSNALEFWRGFGDGNFAPAVRLDVGGSPQALAAGLLDADACLDLAVAIPNQLVLWYGGTAAPSPTLVLPGQASAVAVSEHDGIAITCEVTVFGGIQQRAMWIAVGVDRTAVVDAEIGVPEYIFDITIADVDADGDRDPVLLGPRLQPLRRRPGGFDYGPTAAAGARATAVACLDLDGDAIRDIVVADHNAFGVLLLPGHGDGSFGLLPTFTTGLPQAVVLDDVDGDAELDAVFVGVTTSTMSVHRGTGDGSFGRRTDVTTLPWPKDAVLADLDADGHQDAVVVTCEPFNRPTRGRLAVHRGDGHGGFGPPEETELAGPATGVCASDLDGDGALDVAVTVWDAVPPSDGGLQLFHGRGDGSFGLPTRLAVGPVPMAVACADVDGDGGPDLLASFRQSAVDSRGGVSWLRGPGFSTRSDVLTGIDPRRLVLAHVDSDARLDVVVTSSYFARPERGRLVVLCNNGTDLVPTADVRCAAEPFAPIVADFDADGFADVAVTNASSHTVSFWRGDGTGRLQEHCEVGTGPRPVAIAGADLDHDGRMDLVTADGGASTATVLRRIGVPTPVSVSGLAATRTAGGVRLDWQLGWLLGTASVQVERTPALDVPFAAVGARLEPATEMSFEDLQPLPDAWYRLRLEARSGEQWTSEPVRVAAAPLTLALAMPVVDAAAVRLAYTLPQTTASVQLVIVDARGRRVRSLIDGAGAAGRHTEVWDRRDVGGRRVARGIYWAKLVADGQSVVQRVPIVGR